MVTDLPRILWQSTFKSAQALFFSATCTAYGIRLFMPKFLWTLSCLINGYVLECPSVSHWYGQNGLIFTLWIKSKGCVFIVLLAGTESLCKLKVWPCELLINAECCGTVIMMELVCLCLSNLKQSGDDTVDFFFLFVWWQGVGRVLYYLLVGFLRKISFLFNQNAFKKVNISRKAWNVACCISLELLWLVVR